MKIKQRLFLVLLVVCSCIGCDQFSKHIARKELSGSVAYSFFADTLRLQLFENPGAFLSLGSSLPSDFRFWIFSAGVGFFLIILMAYVVCSASLPQVERLAYSLILGGGFSNLIDRVVRDGRVTDFLNTGVGDLRTGVFNLADMSISLGVCILLLGSLLEKSSTGKKISGDQSDPLPHQAEVPR